MPNFYSKELKASDKKKASKKVSANFENLQKELEDEKKDDDM